MRFNELMSTFFLSPDLRYGLTELYEFSQLNCLASEKGEKNVSCFYSFYFYNIVSLVRTLKSGENLCNEVNSWAFLHVLQFPAPALSPGSAGTRCDNGSNSLDIAGHTQLLHVQSRANFLWPFTGFTHTSLGNYLGLC